MVSSPLDQREVETTTLFDASLGDVPGSGQTVFLEQWRFAPGPATLTIAPYVEPHVVIAEEGTFAIALDGVEGTLAANEARVIPPGQEVVIRSTGSAEARLLHFGITFRFGPTRADSRFITYRTLIGSGGTVPPGALRVAVERFVLPPGTALAPVTLADNAWFGLGGGTVGVALAGERLPLYWSPGEERDFTYPSLFPPIAAGTQVTLRNAADDTLVLYHLQITADADAAVPARASPGTTAAG